MPAKQLPTPSFDFFDFEQGAVYMYADWQGLEQPVLLGTLWDYKAGTRHTHAFEVSEQGMALLSSIGTHIDPIIRPVEGPQFSTDGLFNCMEDSSPDRWGRTLMQRYFERRQRRKQPQRAVAVSVNRLSDVQYLLGVHDPFRMGALRFKTHPEGPFLDRQLDHLAIPTLLDLQVLANAAKAVEDDTLDLTDEQFEHLRLLLAPGGSLGGARPKASIRNNEGYLCIAKFPSQRDEWNKAAWEFLTIGLARLCGVETAPCHAVSFSNTHHTLITQRFDRTSNGARIHFASAMNLAGFKDGAADHSHGVSYFHIANIIKQHGAQTSRDLQQLWRRMAFGVLVKNTDDHLRNHGFILNSGKGWQLSPAYDVNPEPYGSALSLNITDHDNALDLELVRSVCNHYEFKLSEADTVLNDMKRNVAQWHVAARRMQLPAREIEIMSTAFINH